MADIKPSSHGIVVEHKESGVRYAVSDRNYNPKVHRKVRDLHPGETVLAYQPKRAATLGDPSTDPSPANDAGDGSATGAETLVGTPTATPGPTASTKTEGSSSEGTKGTK